MSQPTTLADFHATTIDGKDQDLGTYVGDVVLVVNTASECGLTPQYEGLQQLYDTYADRGLRRARVPVRPVRPPGAGHRGRDRVVLRAELRRLVPDVRQDRRERRRHPPALRSGSSTRSAVWSAATIKWNFTKFLVGRDGSVRRPVRPADRARGAASPTSRSSWPSRPDRRSRAERGREPVSRCSRSRRARRRRSRRR